MPTKHPRISVTLTEKDYQEFQNLAYKKGISMNELGRQFIIQGLNGNLSQQNIDFLTPIFREQLKSIIDPATERLASMTAKTCVQAGTAAYLAAEAILRFVPEDKQMDVEDSYNAARKKAVRYLCGKADMAE